MSKSDDRFRQYEKLMKKSKKNLSEEEPLSCRLCPFFMEDFKYRRCLHARCPYGRQVDVFRRKPLRRDAVPAREVANMKHG